jgi:hypothetical protein
MAYYISTEMDEGRFTQNTLNIQSVQIITWKKVMDIDMVMQYNTPTIQANSRYAQNFFMDAGFVRKILKDRCRLRLYVTDIFNLVREKELTTYGDTRIDFYQKRPTRTLGLAVNYNFRAGKAFTKKKIDQHTSDEKSRL